MLSCSVLTSPPWYGPPRPWAAAQRPTIRLCKAAYLPYLPLFPHLVKFLANTVQINTTCKDYDSINQHSHQSTPTTGPQGGRGANHDHAQGGGGGETLEHIWSRPPAGYPPPPWYGPGRSIGPGTWHAFTAPSLSYVPSRFAFVPALSRVPCKYHRILHHLQRLRLHQPALPPIHNHPTHSHRGRGREP